MNRLSYRLIALLLLFALLAGAATSVAQGPAAIKRAEAPGVSATDEILRTVSRIRLLDIKNSVKSGLKTKDEIEAAVMRDLDESTTPEEFQASQKTLVKLGLIAKDFKLREYVVSLLREQVAGFYEPKTKEFYLAAWLPISEQKRVIAHELVHALQDQHFNLRRFERWPKGDSDAELAAHALIEGDATVVMIQYDLDQEGARIDVTKVAPLTERMLDEDSASDAKNYPVLSAAPRVLRENLQFPYVYGAGFVQAVLKAQSWKALDEGFTDLPASTEQIMHPEKFLSRDNPVKIALPDLLGVLGSDWKQADTDVNGEFGYQVVLTEFISKRAARIAAAGWGGDRYVLLENKGTGASILGQFTTWDTPADAREFFDAYSERTENRYKVTRPADLNARSRVYETGEGLAAVEIRDQDVVIVEGAQNRAQLAKLVERLWQSKKSAK